MRKSTMLLVALLVALTLSACGSKTGQEPVGGDPPAVRPPDRPTKAKPLPTVSPSPTIAPSPTPLGLSALILGYWKCDGEGNSFIELDFMADGTLRGFLGHDFGTYEAVSENTIITKDVDGQQEALRVRDLQGDKFTLQQPNGGLFHCQRIAPIPDLTKAILGLWVKEDSQGKIEEWIGFAPDGRLLSSDDYGTYQAVGTNLISVVQSSGETGGWYVQSATSDALDLGWGFVLRKVQDIPNLAQALVGIWKISPEAGSESGSVEFTAGGKMIMTISSSTSIDEYEILFDRLILVGPKGQQGVWGAIVSLSDDTLEVGMDSFVQADLRLVKTKQP